MIYEVQTPDGRIIEVEGKPGQEDIAIQLVKDYLDKEKTEDKKNKHQKSLMILSSITKKV
jgi:hypothetical protein